jgi:hypothetical protein
VFSPTRKHPLNNFFCKKPFLVIHQQAIFFSPTELPRRTQKYCNLNSLFDFKTMYIYALYLFITLFMPYNLHSITEKKPIKTRSVGTPTDRKNAALQANANIISGEDWELNEQAINHAMILLSALPADSLPQTVKDDIGTIANLCPYVGGNGVLKARTLWMHWQPNAMWDDRVLCMQGQNKNQDNSEIDIDSLYISVIIESNVNNNIAPIIIRIDENKNKLIASEAHDNIQVYPNPASQFVIISYESQTNGYFRMFNSIGELILETELAAYNTKTQVPLPNIANGIYHYEVDFANKIKTIGKLSILKQ